MRNDRYMPSIHAILQSGNLYVYTMNNPLMWNDPSGLFATAAVGGTVYLIVKAIKAGAKTYKSAQKVIDAIAIVTGAYGIYNASSNSSSQAPSNGLAGAGGGTSPGNPDPNNNRRDDVNLNNVDPNNLPDGWTKRIDNGGRIHIQDSAGNYRIRIDPGKKGNPTHRHHYDINRKPVDVHGNPTQFGAPDSHIPMRP